MSYSILKIVALCSHPSVLSLLTSMYLNLFQHSFCVCTQWLIFLMYSTQHVPCCWTSGPSSSPSFPAENFLLNMTMWKMHITGITPWRAVRFSGSAMVLRQKNSVLATKTVTLPAPSSKMQMPVRHSLFHESSLTQAVLADTPRNLSPTSQLKPTGPGNHSICQKQYQATSSWKPVIIANVYLCSTTECFNKSDSSSSTSSFQHSTQNSPMQASLWLPAWLFPSPSWVPCQILGLSSPKSEPNKPLFAPSPFFHLCQSINDYTFFYLYFATFLLPYPNFSLT